MSKQNIYKHYNSVQEVEVLALDGAGMGHSLHLYGKTLVIYKLPNGLICAMEHKEFHETYIQKGRKLSDVTDYVQVDPEVEEWSLDLLVREYTHWIEQHGNGRNDKDLRFGQYILNKYDVEHGMSYQDESATEAYKLLLNTIEEPG